MIHKLLEAIRDMGHASDFEGYWDSLQRESTEGAPTMDEARRDYRALLRSRARTQVI